MTEVCSILSLVRLPFENGTQIQIRVDLCDSGAFSCILTQLFKGGLRNRVDPSINCCSCWLRKGFHTIL